MAIFFTLGIFCCICLSDSYSLTLGKHTLIQSDYIDPVFTPDYSESVMCSPSPGIYESSAVQSRNLTFSSLTGESISISIASSGHLNLTYFPEKLDLTKDPSVVTLTYNCMSAGWSVINVTISNRTHEHKGHFLKYCGQVDTFDFSLAVLLVLAVALVYISAYRARFISSWEPSIEDNADVLTVYHAFAFVFAGSAMLITLFFLKDYLKLVLEVLIDTSGLVSIIGVLDEITAKQPSRSVMVPGIGKVTLKLLMSGLVSTFIICFYIYSKNWVLSNLIGLCFAYVMIKTIKIPNFKVGALLLSLIFFYDIYWVYFSAYFFGDNVMVAVATGINLPIKLMCPHTGGSALPYSCSMLGLGDLALPGLFLAFASRFDHINRSNYLTVLILCYAGALVLCVLVLVIFSHAQPALLYISPALIVGMLSNAAVRGEIREILKGVQPSLVSADQMD